MKLQGRYNQGSSTYPNDDQDSKRQEPSAPSKAPNDDLKTMDVLRTFRIKIRAKI